MTGEKIEKEGKMSLSIFIFIYTIHLASLKVYTKFKNTDSNRSGEIFDRNFGEKEKLTDKGTDVQYVDFFAAQYDSSLSSFVSNFRIPSQLVAEKSLTENVCMYYIRVTEGKIEKSKKTAK